MEESNKKVITNITTDVTPTSVSKEEALKLVHEQNINNGDFQENHIATPIQIDKETAQELSENQFNEVNDLIKVVDVKASKKTYIIMISIIIVLILLFVIFELPMLLNM